MDYDSNTPESTLPEDVFILLKTVKNILKYFLCLFLCKKMTPKMALIPPPRNADCSKPKSLLS